jgi:hypothetical protein
MPKQQHHVHVFCTLTLAMRIDGKIWAATAQSRNIFPVLIYSATDSIVKSGGAPWDGGVT